MKPIELILAKRAHVERLANQSGAEGESLIVEQMETWIPRPRGTELRVLMAALLEAGHDLKRSSFDAIALPDAKAVDLTNAEDVRAMLPEMVFIEIKTANQPRVKAGFSGYFFALTENEICAANSLGDQYRVALFNKLTGELQMTSVSEILARARSTTWQVSVQL